MARLLVIDDETSIRMMLRLALQHVGHEVETAGDGAEGLEKFGDGGAWDLVLLDQRMPGLEGLEVLRLMRARRPDAKIVMVTAFGTIDLAAEAMRAGATDFLRKPFTVDTLRGAVRAALESPASTGDTATDSPDIAAVNGLRLRPGAGIVRDASGEMRDTLTIRTPGGETRECTVTLPFFFVESVHAHAGREEMPEGDRFWQALCGEALANYLWQHADLPPENQLRVEELTGGLRRWIDASLAAGRAMPSPATTD